MKVLSIILLIASNFAILWSIIEYFGSNKANLSKKIILLLNFAVSIMIIVLIKPIFLVVLLLEVIFLSHLLKVKNIKNESENELCIADELILTMKTGISFESALRRVACRYKNLQTFLEKVKEEQTNGQVLSAEFENVLHFSRKNSSLSLKNLLFYREREKLRKKLHLKQKNITLQAKAQAVVSFLIYFGLFIFQFFFSSGFLQWLQSPLGRFLFIISLGFLFLGQFFVFRIAKPSNMEL